MVVIVGNKCVLGEIIAWRIAFGGKKSSSNVFNSMSYMSSNITFARGNQNI